MIILICAISFAIFGDIVQYIEYTILLENLCDIDIAYPKKRNGDNIVILPNPTRDNFAQDVCT